MSYHSDTSLTPMIVAKLISHLPKLLTIEGYQRTGEAIALMHSILKIENPIKLQYVHDRKTKFQSLCAMHLLCPGKLNHTRMYLNFNLLGNFQINRGPRYYLDILAIDIFGKFVPIRNLKKWY